MIGAILGLIWLAIVVLVVVSWWKIFTKAGQPGWAAIIPIYNVYVWLQIIGKPWWWLLLLLIPVVGLVIWILMLVELAKVFGKGVGFAIGMLLLGIVFFPILAFGDAQYGSGEAPPEIPTENT